MNAKEMIIRYDSLKRRYEENEQKSDEIYNRVYDEDKSFEENMKVILPLWHEAGVCDKDGNDSSLTLYVKATHEIVEYILDNIVPSALATQLSVFRKEKIHLADELIDIVRPLMLKNDAHAKANLTLALLSKK